MAMVLDATKILPHGGTAGTLIAVVRIEEGTRQVRPVKVLSTG